VTGTRQFIGSQRDLHLNGTVISYLILSYLMAASTELRQQGLRLTSGLWELSYSLFCAADFPSKGQIFRAAKSLETPLSSRRS
jgi:hypothetical protein